MSLQKYLRHELNTNLDGSASLLVVPPGIGTLAQLKQDIHTIASDLKQAVAMMHVDVSTFDDIGGFHPHHLQAIADASHAVVALDVTGALPAQIELLTETLATRNINGTDISHAHVVVFTHDANAIPTTVKDQLHVFTVDAWAFIYNGKQNQQIFDTTIGNTQSFNWKCGIFPTQR